ncbi:hypothetical protein BH11PLA2_BH11PLA2_38900 [soil metagenome]
MAERMSTATRMDRARANGIVLRGKKSGAKRKLRANKDTRMAKLVKTGKFPFTPAVQSWLSVKAGKPFTQVTPDDVKAILA